MQQSKIRLGDTVKRLIFMGVACCVLLLISGCSGEAFKVTPALQQDWQANVLNCWPCTIYKAVFDATGAMIYNLYGTTVRSALMLLAVGWLFWLSFRTLKLFTAFKDPNVKEYWTDIALVFGKTVIVASIFLTGEGLFYMLNLIVTPIAGAFVELARLVISADPTTAELFGKPMSFVTAEVQKSLALGQYPVLSPAVTSGIQELIYTIYLLLKNGTAVGIHLMAGDFGFGGFVVGIVMMWIFFTLILIFPFSMIEVFIKLGVLMLIFPFILVAWVFPATKGHVRTAWSMFIGTMIQLLLTCVFIAFAVLVLNHFTEVIWPGFFDPSQSISSWGGLNKMRNLDVSALVMLFLLFFIRQFSKNINKFTGAFGGQNATSEFVRLLDFGKKFVTSTALFAFGTAASFFPGLQAVGTGLAAKGAKDMASTAKAAATDTGAGE